MADARVVRLILFVCGHMNHTERCAVWVVNAASIDDAQKRFGIMVHRNVQSTNDRITACNMDCTNITIRENRSSQGPRQKSRVLSGAALFVRCAQNMRFSVPDTVLLLHTLRIYCFFDTCMNVGVSAASRNPLWKLR